MDAGATILTTKRFSRTKVALSVLTRSSTSPRAEFAPNCMLNRPSPACSSPSRPASLMGCVSAPACASDDALDCTRSKKARRSITLPLLLRCALKATRSPTANRFGRAEVSSLRSVTIMTRLSGSTSASKRHSPVTGSAMVIRSYPWSECQAIPLGK